MEVALKRKVSGAAKSGGPSQLWKMDWDSMAPLSPSSISSAMAQKEQLQPEEEVLRDDEFDEKTEEGSNKVEEDSTSNSNMDGPQSSADLLLPSQPHQSPLFLQQQQHHFTPPPLQPRVPQPSVMAGEEDKTTDIVRKEEFNKVEEDSITNSFMDGPLSLADMNFSSIPPHQSPFLLQKHPQSYPHLLQNQPSPPVFPLSKVFWRPWEDPPPTTTKPSPDPPPRRKIRRAKRRSLGDLARRKQRLLSNQKNQPYLFPYTPEPDQSRLESSSWAGVPRQLDWSGMSDFREDNPSPKSWYSSSPCWMYSPSPGPPSPPPWLSSNMAPPSPVYCDGCHSWGNLLTVTVSEARGI